mmetsp:Transcript_37157/g.107044  ORF Transcript_37157/g.107044 Transcript_37157/m.107044 type:complete len:218 (-) Transcript_37157:178-831(-)
MGADHALRPDLRVLRQRHLVRHRRRHGPGGREHRGRRGDLHAQPRPGQRPRRRGLRPRQPRPPGQRLPHAHSALLPAAGASAGGRPGRSQRHRCGDRHQGVDDGELGPHDDQPPAHQIPAARLHGDSGRSDRRGGSRDRGSPGATAAEGPHRAHRDGPPLRDRPGGPACQDCRGLAPWPCDDPEPPGHRRRLRLRNGRLCGARGRATLRERDHHRCI